eukprot:SAG31_NODE_16715_length_698_cov_2.171953_1_plen_78_part_00
MSNLHCGYAIHHIIINVLSQCLLRISDAPMQVLIQATVQLEDAQGNDATTQAYSNFVLEQSLTLWQVNRCYDIFILK